MSLGELPMQVPGQEGPCVLHCSSWTLFYNWAELPLDCLNVFMFVS